MRFSSAIVAVYAVAAGTVYADQVCENGIYAVLAPLSKYPPAQNFCAKKYPASNTKRALDLTKRDDHHPQCRRRVSDGQSTSTVTGKTTMSTSTVSKTAIKDKNEELLSSLQVLAQNVAKTFCSCIQQPKTTTTAKSTTTKSTSTGKATTTSAKTSSSTTTSSKKTTTDKTSSSTSKTGISTSSSSFTTSSKTTTGSSSSSSSSTTKTSSTLTTSTSTSSSSTKTSSTLTTTSATTTTSTSASSSTPTTTSSTTTVSSTTSSTSSSTTSAVASGPTFKISVQVTANRKQKRLTLWVKFSGNDASVVESEAEASTFTIVDGYLMYGSEYVVTSGTGYSTFSKSATKPTEPGTWSSSAGQVTLGGAQGFCYTADKSIIVILTQQPPMACTSVALVEDTNIVVSSSTTTTTTSPTTPGPKVTSKAVQTGQWTTASPTTRSTTSTISCIEGVYTATARCSCRWSIRCNSHAVSEFGTEPTKQTAQTWQECTEACNANMMCSGLWYDPGSLTCYLYDTPGDNVLYGYNTGPWIALSPLDCEASCPTPTTTKRVATTTSASPTPVNTGCKYEEYKATSGGCNCVWPIKCGTQVNTTPDTEVVLPNHHDCVNLCDRTSVCQLFTYDPATSICRLWNDANQPALSGPGVYWCARLDNWCPASQCPS